MILYFSGNGNSRWVAEQLASFTADTAVDAACCMREGRVPKALEHAGRLGIVFPIHSWYAPHVFVRFLRSLALPGTVTYRYAVCTCGDDAGKAMNRLSRYIPLDSAWSVIMPNTYIPMFHLDSDEVCRSKVDSARVALEHISQAVLAGKSEWNVHEGGAAWLKTYVVNPLFVHLVVGNRKFDVDQGCVSCGTCVSACPIGNVSLAAGKPRWGNACIHCMACVHACPAGAIQYGNATRKRGRYSLKKYL